MVKKVTVRLTREGAETVNSRLMPDINLQYIIAIMILDGGLSFDAAHDYRRLHDNKVREMMALIDLLGDESLFHPSAPRPALVEVTTVNGGSFHERVTSSRGTPENPMTDEEVERKAFDLITPTWGNDRSHALIDKIRGLESLPSIAEITSLLRTNPVVA
jgi:2-methylcitrate dehydratase PrpD